MVRGRGRRRPSHLTPRAASLEKCATSPPSRAGAEKRIEEKRGESAVTSSEEKKGEEKRGESAVTSRRLSHLKLAGCAALLDAALERACVRSPRPRKLAVAPADEIARG